MLSLTKTSNVVGESISNLGLVHPAKSVEVNFFSPSNGESLIQVGLKINMISLNKDAQWDYYSFSSIGIKVIRAFQYSVLSDCWCQRTVNTVLLAGALCRQIMCSW